MKKTTTFTMHECNEFNLKEECTEEFAATPSGARRLSPGPTTRTFVQFCLLEGSVLGYVGAILWLSWEDLWVTWVHLVVSFCNVGAILGYLGRTWGRLGSALGTISHAKWKLLILQMFYKCF